MPYSGIGSCTNGVATGLTRNTSPTCSQQPTLGQNGGTGGRIALNGATSGSDMVGVAVCGRDSFVCFLRKRLDR